jgi:hypothetical protein
MPFDMHDPDEEDSHGETTCLMRIRVQLIYIFYTSGSFTPSGSFIHSFIYSLFLLLLIMVTMTKHNRYDEFKNCKHCVMARTGELDM